MWFPMKEMATKADVTQKQDLLKELLVMDV